MITCTLDGNSIEIMDDWIATYKSKHRSTFQCTTTNQTLNFGDELELKNGSEIIFKGIVSGLKKFDPYDTKQVLMITIEGKDYSAIADKRVIAQVLSAVKAEDAITNYILPILAEEGITAGTIDADFTINRDVWRYFKVSECLDRLADCQVGYYWYIDFNKKLHFLNVNSASIVTLNDSTNYTNMVAYRDMDTYRNTQYLITPDSRTVSQPNEVCSPQADGSTRTFMTRYPIAEEPTLSYTNDVTVVTPTWVNINAADVGVNGFDDGMKWYWSYNSNTLTQADTETVLPAKGAIRATYIGLRKAVIKVTNETAIDDRKIKEGNSGIYEEVQELLDMDDFYEACKYCRNLLTKYCDIADKIEFDTHDSKFVRGYRILFDSVFFLTQAYYLIDSIIVTQETPVLCKYSITAFDSTSIGQWEKYFYDLYKNQRKVVLNADEILTKITGIDEEINLDGLYELWTNIGFTIPFTIPFTIGTSTKYIFD